MAVTTSEVYLYSKHFPNKKRDTLNGVFTLNYDCPFGQVMSYEILRIAMIGFAKFEIGNHIITFA